MTSAEKLITVQGHTSKANSLIHSLILASSELTRATDDDGVSLDDFHALLEDEANLRDLLLALVKGLAEKAVSL